MPPWEATPGGWSGTTPGPPRVAPRSPSNSSFGVPPGKLELEALLGGGGGGGGGGGTLGGWSATLGGWNWKHLVNQLGTLPPTHIRHFLHACLDHIMRKSYFSCPHTSSTGTPLVGNQVMQHPVSMLLSSTQKERYRGWGRNVGGDS